MVMLILWHPDFGGESKFREKKNDISVFKKAEYVALTENFVSAHCASMFPTMTTIIINIKGLLGIY